MRKLLLGYLVLTAGLGSLLLLFPGTVILPLKASEANCAFMIMAPVLFAQVVVFVGKVLKGGRFEGDVETSLNPRSVWLMKAGGFTAAGIISVAILGLLLGSFETTRGFAISPDNFLAGIAFAAAILNTLLQVPTDS